jgi:undecaprenyl pyrophosphate phosphatase UppP
MSQQNQKKNNTRKWLGLINIPIQMGITVFLSSLIGKWFDNKYPNQNNIYVKIFAMGGVAIALYNVIKQVNKLNDKED